VWTRAILALACALACGLAGEAAAQPVARAADRRAERAAPHAPPGIGGTLTVGRAGMPDTETGWLVRLDLETFPVFARAGIPGPFLGFHTGFEIWSSSRGGGFGMPITMVVGVRAQPVRASIGFGFEGLTIEAVDDDTGVGLYQPFASARLGFDVFGVQLGADARVVRRWQIGAPDHTQWQVGAFAGMTWEGKDRGPRY